MKDESAGPASSAETLFDPDSRRPTDADRVIDAPQRTNDPKALKQKAVSDKVRALQDEADLRAVLAIPEGVRFIARLIAGPCGWNAPYFQPSNSVMCEVAGRRSIAYQLEQWISDADISLWIAVRRELENHRPKAVKPATTPSKSASSQ